LSLTTVQLSYSICDPAFLLGIAHFGFKQPHSRDLDRQQGGVRHVRSGFSIARGIVPNAVLSPSPHFSMAHAKETSAAKEANSPVQTFRLRGLSASIFENHAKSASRTVTFQRTYRDGDEWKTTTSFGRDDLPIAKLLLERSWQYILDCEASRGRESDGDDE
jgi:hypothetical protein